MQPFQVSTRESIVQLEDLKQILGQIPLKEDLLLKAQRIHHPRESRDQEITIQDLMINKTITT